MTEMQPIFPQPVKLPAWGFVCGRDYVLRQGEWRIGLYWRPDPNYVEGHLAYRRAFMIRVRMPKIWFEQERW